MRLVGVATTLFFVSFPSTNARCESSAISVRVVHGKTGKPIGNQRIYVSFDGKPYSVDEILPKDGTVDVEGSGHRTMQITVVGVISCGEQRIGQSTREYTIDQIAKHGYVSKNTCGQPASEPRPGEFTYYVRPATWWELFRN